MKKPKKTTARRPVGRKSWRTILVPVDFSGCSRQAFRDALALAREVPAKILLLHVARTGYPGSRLGPLEPDRLFKAMRQQAEQEMDAWIAEEQPAPVEVQKLIVHGESPYAEIVSEAERRRADLIVIGTHGRGALAHLVLGSTSERVVRHAPCPVLTVREP